MTALPEDPVTLARLLGVDDEEITWHERAVCAQVDPELFYPEKGGSTAPAKRVCAGCPARVECLTYALDHDERFGIWGGMSERERRRARRDGVRCPECPGAGLFRDLAKHARMTHPAIGVA